MTADDDSIFRLATPPGAGGLRVLALGAHPDDIEIGCGATILRLVGDGLVAEARWVVFSGEGARADEARAGAAAFLDGVAHRDVEVHSFRDGFLPLDGTPVKEAFEALKAAFRPDLVLSHRLADRHQDHRFVAELTWQTFRECPILEYEIPKYEGDLGSPNLYVRVSADIAHRKVALLREVFASQADRSWFTDETFLALLRLRGIECRAGSGYAEGFEARTIL